ncbi:hypothetical protein GCM10011591_11860 [Nocardia camponoti]|uniref:Uncharacterized protein n=1 Tax=Nocardia camponoti TaxID=1616106 RepID=A0A917V5W6_9NOCA|nr:hypothetical protein GCM10011591_11860 [Nocardia camponoti]
MPPTVASPPAAPGQPSGPTTKPAGNGTIEVTTVTLGGSPVPGVSVRLSLQRPCDPATHDIPLGETSEVKRLDGVTNMQGKVSFTAETGCYYLGMTAPPGTSPVPEGMHTIFLVNPGDTATGKLRFNDVQPQVGVCDEATIETELGVNPSPVATIDKCDGKWAVIRWDTPGDNQRLVTRVPGRWQTYTIFPHDICWSAAEREGVPPALRTYFSNC